MTMLGDVLSVATIRGSRSSMGSFNFNERELTDYRRGPLQLRARRWAIL